MKTPTNAARTGQAAHTPTPYRVLDGAITCEQVNDYGNFIVVSCDRERTAQDDATLAFIVRACNSHDALVEAAATLDEVWDHWCGGDVPPALQQRILAALGRVHGPNASRKEKEAVAIRADVDAAHDRLSDLLEDEEASNEAIRDAAVALCEALVALNHKEGR